MLGAGFSVAAPDKAGETALHNASWMGQLATVKILLAADAPLEVRERRYGATPLQWAIHGLENSRDPEGKTLGRDADHIGVIQALVAAGAHVSVEMWQELPEHLRTVIRPSGPQKKTWRRAAVRNQSRRVNPTVCVTQAPPEHPAGQR